MFVLMLQSNSKFTRWEINFIIPNWLMLIFILMNVNTVRLQFFHSLYEFNNILLFLCVRSLVEGNSICLCDSPDHPNTWVHTFFLDIYNFSLVTGTVLDQSFCWEPYNLTSSSPFLFQLLFKGSIMFKSNLVNLVFIAKTIFT